MKQLATMHSVTDRQTDTTMLVDLTAYINID